MRPEETILPFSLKYDTTHCQAYFDKHQASASRRVSNYLEQRMANKALQLTTNVSSCLDLPCGTGRFWDRLFLSGVQDLIAADYSQDMLNLAARVRPLAQVKKTKLLKTSAFAIDLPDQSVDLLFCMRLLHHIGVPEDRSTILKEFSRVTRDEILVSLWVDGNLQASRRKSKKRSGSPQGIRTVSSFLQTSLKPKSPRAPVWRSLVTSTCYPAFPCGGPMY